MKYLRTYYENIRNLMTPKSDDEILKSLKDLDNYDILQKSIDNNFLKGVELALQHELTNRDIVLIIIKIFYINNKELVRLLLDKVRNKLTEDQVYILEKYKLGLHQNEEKPYERWFKDQLSDLSVSRSKEYSSVLIYKKDDIVLYNYEEKNEDFYIDYNKIWSIFESKYFLKNNEIKLLTKSIVKKYFNLINIKIFSATILLIY
jgi:hypothetical protein